MAVRDRGYRRWTGRPRGRGWRILAITRLGLAQVFERKRMAALMVLFLLPPLGIAAATWLASASGPFGDRLPRELFEFLDTLFGAAGFEHFTWVQATLAGILVVLAGPALLTRDMANDALPLYFSKGITRADYLLGKALVVGVLTSAVTWVPLLLVFGLKYLLATPGYRADHAYLAGSILAVSLAFIAVLTALALAVSAHVRHEWAGQGLLLALLLFLPAIGERLAAALEQPLVRLALDPLAGTRWLSDSAFRLPGGYGAAAGLAGVLAWTVVATLLSARRVRPTTVVS